MLALVGSVRVREQPIRAILHLCSGATRLCRGLTTTQAIVPEANADAHGTRPRYA